MLSFAILSNFKLSGNLSCFQESKQKYCLNGINTALVERSYSVLVCSILFSCILANVSMRKSDLFWCRYNSYATFTSKQFACPKIGSSSILECRCSTAQAWVGSYKSVEKWLFPLKALTSYTLKVKVWQVAHTFRVRLLNKFRKHNSYILRKCCSIAVTFWAVSLSNERIL